MGNILGGRRRWPSFLVGGGNKSSWIGRCHICNQRSSWVSAGCLVGDWFSPFFAAWKFETFFSRRVEFYICRHIYYASEHINTFIFQILNRKEDFRRCCCFSHTFANNNFYRLFSCLLLIGCHKTNKDYFSEYVLII